jgi:pimeloyl-ACP methyl ester carboxylesterase
MTVVSWIVLAAFVFLLLIYLLQDRLLYHPVRSSLQYPPAAGLRPWPSAGDFRGWIAEPAGSAARTAVLFHGNGGHAAERTYYAQVLGALGFRVILAEYPGYGPRAGATGEASLVADAAETLVRAHRQYGAPLLVVGESLGAGVAAAAAPRQPAAVAGLLLITPWDRLVHVASHHYPWLPVRWMLRDRYDSVAHLQNLDRPVAIVVAEHDSVVPARLGRALHAARAGRPPLIVLEGSDHSDWFDRVGAGWWEAATDAALGRVPALPGR